MKKQEAADCLALAQNTLELWLSFRKYLQRAFTEDPIGGDEEASFLEVKSSVARNVRQMGERFNDKQFPYGGDKISGLLRSCVSVSHLRSLPLSDRRGLYKEWHTASVLLSRTVGAYKFINEGYEYVPPKGGGSGAPQGGQSIAAIKAGAKTGPSAKKAGGGSKKGVVALVVVGAAAAVWWFMFKK